MLFIGNKVKLTSIPEGLNNYYGHYVNDIGKIVNFITKNNIKCPVVEVKDRISTSTYAPYVLWDNENVTYELIDKRSYPVPIPTPPSNGLLIDIRNYYTFDTIGYSVEGSEPSVSYSGFTSETAVTPSYNNMIVPANNDYGILSSNQSSTVKSTTYSGLLNPHICEIRVGNSGDRSLSFWLKTPASHPNLEIFGLSYDIGIYNDDIVTLNGSKLLFTNFGGSYTVNGTHDVINGWNHIVVVYNSSSFLADLYLNGVLDMEDIYYSDNVYIGGNSTFLYDELATWNRALTTDDISTLYNGGTGVFYPDFTT